MASRCRRGPAPLRAAVEVAAYRIAAEAVSNAVRHAGAATCTVSLGLSSEDLLVEITDDGRGVPADAVPGVGRRACASGPPSSAAPWT